MLLQKPDSRSGEEMFGLPRSERMAIRSEEPYNRIILGHVAPGALHERDADLRSPGSPSRP